MTYIVELKKKIVVDTEVMGGAKGAIEYAVQVEKNLPVWKVKVSEYRAKS